MQKIIPLGFLPLLSLFANWPQYHGPMLDKSTGFADRSAKNFQTTDKILWKIPTPLGFSSFTIHSDRAYTLVAEEDEDGLLREKCIAVDLQSGKIIWGKSLGLATYGHGGGNAGTKDNSGGDGPRSTPSIANDRVFVYDSEMTLHCLSADSGRLLWKVDIIRAHQGVNIMWKNASSPLLVNDLVVICGGGPGQSFIGLEQDSGKVRWKSGDETLTHTTPAFAKIHGEDQIIFLCRSGMVSLAPANGKELWRQEFPFKVSTAASPVVANDFIFCSAGYGVGAGLFKLSRNNGSWQSTPVWRKHNEMMNHWSTPLHYQGNLYGIFGFKEYGKAPLQCIDLQTGTIKWSKEGFGPGNLIRVGSTLVVLSDKGEIVTLDANPAKYTELERRKVLDGKCWSTPTLSNQYLLVRSTKEAAALMLKD